MGISLVGKGDVASWVLSLKLPCGVCLLARWVPLRFRKFKYEQGFELIAPIRVPHDGRVRRGRFFYWGSYRWRPLCFRAGSLWVQLFRLGAQI